MSVIDQLAQKLDYSAIFEEACRAAREAAKAHDADLGPEAKRGFDCGFAWVVLRPATHPLVRWCKKEAAKIAEIARASGVGDVPSVKRATQEQIQRLGSKHWDGGWCFWNPSRHPTQSISTLEAGARAFRDVLAKYGISAEVGSRYD